MEAAAPMPLRRIRLTALLLVVSDAIAALMLAAAMTVSGWACKSKKEEAPPPVVTVDVAPVLLAKIERTIRAEGLVYPKQQAASEYARNFQKEGAENMIKPEQLAFWVTDADGVDG